MLVRHLMGLFQNPTAEWARIRDQDYSIADCLLRHTLLFALIPALSGFIGTTQIGWRLGQSRGSEHCQGSSGPNASARGVSRRGQGALAGGLHLQPVALTSR